MHNGWTFVSKPHIVVLEPEFAGQVKMGSKASSTSSLKGKRPSIIKKDVISGSNRNR